MPGPPEILLILGVVVLLFGGRKLPELARGSGRALRIFKSEIRASEDEDQQADVNRSVDSADPKPLESRDADDKSA